MRVLYVEMPDAERAALERLTANSGAAEGRPLTLSEVVRQLVRDAVARGRPVRIPRSPQRARTGV